MQAGGSEGPEVTSIKARLDAAREEVRKYVPVSEKRRQVEGALARCEREIDKARTLKWRWRPW